MPAADLAQLLASSLAPEPFARQSLALLESQTRELALLALGAWENLGLSGFGDLAPALAAMEHPTWGSWNGLFHALQQARDQVLATGTAADRAKSDNAPGLADLLQFWNRPLAAGTFSQAIASAMNLAHRLAYGAPPEASWWIEAQSELRPLIAFLATDPLVEILRRIPRRAPWFVQEESQVWSLEKHAPDFSAIYSAPGAPPRTTPANNAGLEPAFARLLGIPHEPELRRLLARHASEEIRGVLLGDFLVGRPVGEGGFGAVHVGRQLSTGRKVAIKILHDGMPPEIKERFQREAAYLARFNHRHIVGVLGYGEARWSVSPLIDLSADPWFQQFAHSAPMKHFIAMEWVQGQTLESLFQQSRQNSAQRPDTRTLADQFAQAARALHAVHSAGLVHRDVKPANLMLTDDGVIKLMDFGIARTQNETRTLITTPGHVFGTIVYMSPEQIRAADAESLIGPATDIYSLCATFYELFTLTRLYEHDSQSVETVKTLKLTGRPPEPPRKAMRDLPWEIEVILLGGLEAEMADRYRSMESLARDLNHFLHDEPIEYRRPSLARRTQLGYRRHRAVTNILAAGLLAAVIGTGFYIHSINQEQARTLAQRELAQKNAIESNNRLAASYEEQGRQELLAGEPLRAAVYLSEAYSMGRDGPSTRFLLANAARAIPPHVYASQGHTRGVYTAEYNHDGTQIVTAGRDGLVKIWDAKTGRILQTLTLDPANEVTGAMFNPAATRIVAVDDGGHGAVWDAQTGQQLFRLQGLRNTNDTPCFSPDGTQILTSGSITQDAAANAGCAVVWDATDGHRLFLLPHKGHVVCAIFNRAGTKIITGSDDRSAAIWDAKTGKQLHSLATTEKVTRAVFSADGSKAAVSSLDFFTPVKIYDVETGQRLQGLPGHQETIHCCLFDPMDDKILVTCSRQNSARLWDWQSGESVVLAHSEEVLSAAFSHDGKWLGTAGRKEVKLWDVARKEAAGQLVGHDGYVYQLAFSPDDKKIVTAGEDKTARVWDARTHQLLLTLDGRPPEAATPTALLHEIRIGNPVLSLSLSPDGTKILVINDAPSVMDSATGEGISGSGPLGGRGTAGCFSPDGKHFAVLDTVNQVATIDLFGEQNVLIERLDHELNCIAYAPDNARVIVGGISGAWILDRSLHILKTLPLAATTGQVVHVEFNPDGNLALTAGTDGSAKIWDPATAELKATLPHAAAVTWASFSSSGTTVLTASRDATAALWDAATGKKLRTLENAGHKDYVFMARFSPDGKKIVTANRDYSAAVWDAATGARIASLEGHAGPLTSANFSADGNLVVTASQDGKAIVWDAAAGKVLEILQGHQLDVTGAEFTADGLRIVTGGQDGTVKIWDAHLETRTPADIAQLVKTRVPWRLEDERLVPVNLPPDAP